MKKIVFIISFLIVCTNALYSQNLISNPSFEEHYNNCTSSSDINFNDNFDSIATNLVNKCVLKDWMAMSEYPYVFSLRTSAVFSLPSNMYSKHVYPHSDSVIIGIHSFASNVIGGGFPIQPNLRSVIENKLKSSLVLGHKYEFKAYVHLLDTIDGFGSEGQIVGINSFSAYFSDTVVNWAYHTPFPMGKFTPQIQINQMVTDTGNWVLLTDSFIAKGGERYVCIGNFKPDSLTGWQLVDSIRNKHRFSYYFYDDVSLIDITPNGVEEVGVGKLELYPNPVTNELRITNYDVRLNAIEVMDMLGRKMNVAISGINTENCQLNTENLPLGMYYIKISTANGIIENRKFVKQ